MMVIMRGENEIIQNQQIKDIFNFVEKYILNIYLIFNLYKIATARTKPADACLIL